MSSAESHNHPDPEPRVPLSKTSKLGLLVILLVSLGLRLGSIDHGMPANYVPDTHIVRSALGMAKDKNPVPEVGVYSTYPNLLPYLLLPVYAVEYGAGRVSGAWGGAAEFGNHALEHPEDVHLPARVLVAVLSSLLPLVAFFAARAMGLGLGAWIAAWLAATGLLGVHFSTQERPWEPMVLFMLLATWPAANYVTGGARRALVLSCVAAGLAFATHQAGAAALLIPAVAWLLVAVPRRGPESLPIPRLLADGLLAVGAFALVGIMLGHPYLLVHGGTETGAVVMGEELEQASGAISIGGQGYIMTLRPASFERLSKALFGYDPVLTVLGLLGFLFAWRRRSLWPALAFLFAWGVLFLFGSNDHVRYLLPLAGLLCLPAGLFVERVLGGRPLAAGGKLVLALLMAFPLVQAARLVFVLGQDDVRAAVAEGLAEGDLLPAGARLAIDRYGPEVPLDRLSLERIQQVRTLGAREAYRLAFLADLAAAGLDPNDPDVGPVGGAGFDVVYLSDYIEFDDRRNSFHVHAPGFEDLGVDALLDALGVTHVLFADKTPGDGTLSLLLAPELGWRDGQPTPAPLSGLSHRAYWPSGELSFDSRHVFSPSEEGPIEARLPTELDFALTGIWQANRPGPALYLFERETP